MSIAEGLASTDAAKIKAARGAAKGQVTKNINILQDSLVIEDDKFLHDEIDDDMVQAVAQKLDVAFEQFVDLHERFLGFRTKEADANVEKENLKQEENYSVKIRKYYKAIKRSYVKCKKANDNKAIESAKEMKIALMVDVVEDEKKVLDSKLKAAREVIDSEDEYVRSTAKLMKEELIEAVANYKTKVNELKAATKAPKDSETEGKYDTAALFALDCDLIEKLKTELSAVIKKTDSLNESIKRSSSVSDVNQSLSQSNN